MTTIVRGHECTAPEGHYCYGITMAGGGRTHGCKIRATLVGMLRPGSTPHPEREPEIIAAIQAIYEIGERGCRYSFQEFDVLSGALSIIWKWEGS